MCNQKINTNEKNTKNEVDDFTIRDYEQFCLIYHDPESPYLYEFDKIENNNIKCKKIQRTKYKDSLEKIPEYRQTLKKSFKF